MNPMKILVTGGAGFVGSNFIKHTLSTDDSTEIVCFDLLTYAGRLENLREVRGNSKFRFVQGDIRERNSLETLVKEGFDLIVNFAAETHVDRSIVEADSFVLTDAYGTYVLLEAARKFDVERFVQISTDEVYGSIRQGSFKEDHMLSPSSPYSASKAAGDHMALAFHRTYGLSVVVTRSSNNYGPCQHPEKLIPKLILRALHNQPLSIYADGKQVRDWLYVTDNCEAIELAANEGKSGEIYNVASSEEHMNIEVAKNLLKLLGKPEGLIRFVADRPGHDRRYSLDTAKIRALGWKSKVKFEEGLENTARWYEKNQWWWKPLLEDKFFKTDTPWLQ